MSLNMSGCLVSIAYTIMQMNHAQSMRFAFIYDRLNQGWTGETAGPVSWALIPFDDAPVPPRALEKLVRKRARTFAKDIRSQQQDQFKSLSLALDAAKDYISYAHQIDSPYFIDFWEKLRLQAETALPQ